MRQWTEVPFREQHAEPRAIALPPGQARVFVALPTYNGYHKSQALMGLLMPSVKANIHYEIGFGSLLATNFNHLLVGARNSQKEAGWTDWAMHHADVSVPPLWLDAMVDEKRRVGADVLSAVIAIKDERRLTSTGVVEANGTIRRLTLKEVHRLPETFSAADTTAAGIVGELVVNTGLLLVDFTQPWARDFCFSLADSIATDPDGTQRPLSLPEDWNFSHWCNEKGLRLFATRKLLVQHWDGGTCWDNGPHPDEGWDTDLGDDPSRYGDVRKAREKEVAGKERQP